MLDQIVIEVINKLKEHPKRLRHVFGVYHMSSHLANIYKLDLEKVRIAAIFHDYCRMDSLEKQKEYLSEENIKIPILFHAYCAANIIKNKFYITDIDIINPIESHVFGRKGMSNFEKVLFISDFCEITRPYKFRQEAVNLAEKDLNKAVLYVYEKTLSFLKTKNISPSIIQLEAYEYYKGSE